MTRLSTLVILLAVIAAFALSAGCTFNIPGAPNVTPGVTVQKTATPIATGTVIATATRTATATATATRTGTVTATHTATPTRTVTATGTATVTSTVTPTTTGTAAGPGAISGTKWNDLNGDHTWDEGEPALANWTITLQLQEQNGPNWAEVARTLTGADGTYSFAGLAEGHYRVFEVAQSGWTQTYPTDEAGMHNLVISNGRPTWTGQDFGNTVGSTVTGTVTATATTTVTATPTGSVTPTATVTGTVTGTATPTATSTGTGGGTALTGLALTANNLAFDKTTLSAPAGSVIGLVFLNNDAGVQHNFALYTDSTATTPIFRGAIVTGQVTTTYTFTAPSTPGTYFFRCDVHPTTMTGTFIVT